jgi:hypothetical protein
MTVAVEISIQISPEMFEQDERDLRAWLEAAYPGQWTERRARPQGTLGTAEVVFVFIAGGVVQSLGQAVIDRMIEAVHKRIKDLSRQYTNKNRPPAEVVVCEVPDAPEPDVPAGAA